MATAGTVEIDFAAETAKFTAALKDVRSQLKDLQDSTSAIAEVFSAATDRLSEFVSVASVVELGKKVIDSTVEGEAAVTRLNAALSNAGPSAVAASQQFQVFAEQQQRLTIYSKASVEGVESLLLSFKGLSGTTVLQATKTVEDLSSRMGIDLHAAAVDVGKALQDPATALTSLQRIGITFSASQKETIKTLVEFGDKAEAQQIILKTLQERFEGASDAASKTLGGALAQLKNSFGDLLEAKNGAPGVTAAINDLSKTLQSDETKQGFASMVTAVTAIVTALTIGVDKLSQFGSGLGSLLAKSSTPKSTPVTVLQDQLGQEQDNLAEMLTFATDKQITEQKALIATLQQRLELTKQLQPERDFTAAAQPAADSIIDQITSGNAAKANALTSNFVTKDDDQLQLIAENFNRKFLDPISEANTAALDKIKADDTSNDAFMLSSFAEWGEKKLTLMRQQGEQELDIQHYYANQQFLVEKQIRDDKYTTVQVAAQFLELLGQKSKAAAIAAIALNQGLQIAHAVQNTAAAVTMALASVPYPASLAAAAQVEAMGAIQIGIIAATGALQIANVSSGGGSSASAVTGSTTATGVPANPALPAAAQATGVSPSTQIFLQVEGVVTSGAARAIAEALKDVISNNNVTIIEPTSRQARILSKYS